MTGGTIEVSRPLLDVGPPCRIVLSRPLNQVFSWFRSVPQFAEYAALCCTQGVGMGSFIGFHAL